MIVRELVTKLGFQVDNNKLKSFESGIGRIKNLVAGLAIGTGIAMLGKSILDATGSVESLNTQFEVLLGSAELGKKMSDDIRQFAKVTPFATEALSKSASMMLSFGISSENVMSNLNMLGDIAGNDANKLDSLTLAFSQVSSNGKLMGQDLLQMINAGFNPLEIISKQTGKTMAQLRKEMEAGAISADMVRGAMQTATSEGGRFYQNMIRQGQTFQGLMSTLKDSFTEAFASFGQKILPTLKQLLNWLINIVSNVLTPIFVDMGSALNAGFKIAIDFFNKLSAIAIPVLVQIFSVLQETFKPFMQFRDVFAQIIPFIQWVFGLISRIVTIIAPLSMAVGQLGATLIKLGISLYQFFKPLIDFVINVLFLRFKFIVSFFTTVVQVVTWLAAIIASIFNNLNVAFGKDFENAIKWLMTLLEDFQKFVTDIWTSVFGWITKSIDTIIGWINKLPFVKDKIPSFLEAQGNKDPNGSLQNTIANNQKQVNIQMQNAFNINTGGAPLDTSAGAQSTMSQAANSAFSLELKRLIVSTL